MTFFTVTPRRAYTRCSFETELRRIRRTRRAPRSGRPCHTPRQRPGDHLPQRTGENRSGGRATPCGDIGDKHQSRGQQNREPECCARPLSFSSDPASLWPREKLTRCASRRSRSTATIAPNANNHYPVIPGGARCRRRRGPRLATVSWTEPRWDLYRSRAFHLLAGVRTTPIVDPSDRCWLRRSSRGR